MRFQPIVRHCAIVRRHAIRTPEIEKTSDLRVRIHAHHIHVASQLLALRTRDVAGLIHVLDHAQLDAVAFTLDLLGLFLRFGADAHIRTRPQRGFAASVVQQQAGAVLGVVRVAAHLLIQSVDHMFDRIHLHHTRMREQLIVAEQRGRAPDTAVHAFRQRAHAPLQRLVPAFDAPDHTA